MQEIIITVVLAALVIAGIVLIIRKRSAESKDLDDTLWADVPKVTEEPKMDVEVTNTAAEPSEVEKNTPVGIAFDAGVGAVTSSDVSVEKIGGDVVVVEQAKPKRKYTPRKKTTEAEEKTKKPSKKTGAKKPDTIEKKTSRKKSK